MEQSTITFISLLGKNSYLEGSDQSLLPADRIILSAAVYFKNRHGILNIIPLKIYMKVDTSSNKSLFDF